MPFNFYLWIAVISSFFIILVADKALRMAYAKVENPDEHIDMKVSKIGFNILGIYVLQGVNFKQVFFFYFKTRIRIEVNGLTELCSKFRSKS